MGNTAPGPTSIPMPAPAPPAPLLCPNISGHNYPIPNPSQIIYRCHCGIVVHFSIPLAFEGGGGFREPQNSIWEVNIGRTSAQGNHPKRPVALPHPKDPRRATDRQKIFFFFYFLFLINSYFLWTFLIIYFIYFPMVHSFRGGGYEDPLQPHA